MTFLREVTQWADGSDKMNHTYAFKGSQCVGYIPNGQTELIIFATPLKNFNKKYRKFEKVKL